MKKLLLVLAPMLLLAQVEVDTVIHVPSFIMNGYFIPELNKLYLLGSYEHIALDCSTYQLRARIPRSWDMGYGFYSWNWRRQKLYVYVNPAPDSLVVIDAAADTLMRTLPVPGKQAYVASTDRLYIESNESLYELDCATDSVVRQIQVPVSDYIYCSTPCWDSVSDKIYVALARWGGPALVAAYDCSADSFVAVLDLGSTWSSGWVNLDQTCQKAYCAPDGGNLVAIDTKHDTVTRSFPIRCGQSMFNQMAMNTKDHKAYIPYSSTSTAETIYVIDCFTDSIVRKIVGPASQWPLQVARWVPWSNRVYLTRPTAPPGESLGMIVVDCNTDSIIVSDFVLGYWPPFDFQIDPIRERVFAIGCESTSVHVLRDVEGGVAESPAAAPGPSAPCQLRELRDAVELEYHLESVGRVDVAVFDPCGRRIKTLASERQMPGRHNLKWDRTDSHGTKVTRGAYFIVLNTGDEQARLKAVVR